MLKLKFSGDASVFTGDLRGGRQQLTGKEGNFSFENFALLTNIFTKRSSSINLLPKEKVFTSYYMHQFSPGKRIVH